MGKLKAVAKSENNKLTDEELAECRALKELFESKKKGLKLTQDSVGGMMGISQSAVGHYLHGRNALNLQAAVKFANILQVAVGQFSQRLAQELSLYNSTPIEEHVITETPTNFRILALGVLTLK